MDIQKVKETAQAEIESEEFKAAVSNMKLQMKLKLRPSIWDKIFPFRILIIRKEEWK